MAVLPPSALPQLANLPPRTANRLRSGMLDVQPQKAGPLMVPGNVEPVSGTGRTVNRATRVFFGRGSQSRTKPCCDNSHKSVGFIADPG